MVYNTMGGRNRSGTELSTTLHVSKRNQDIFEFLGKDLKRSWVLARILLITFLMDGFFRPGLKMPRNKALSAFQSISCPMQFELSKFTLPTHWPSRKCKPSTIMSPSTLPSSRSNKPISFQPSLSRMHRILINQVVLHWVKDSLQMSHHFTYWIVI